MNYAKLIISCTFVGLLLSLAGCAKKSNYKPRHLKSLTELLHVDYQETKEQVTIRAKAFTENDCEKVFGQRADRIISGKNPLQTIQLCIENNGSSTWELLESNTGLPLVPAKEVEKRLSSHNSFTTAGIFGGIGILAALAGLNLMLPAVTCICCLPFFFLGIGLTTAGGIFIAATPFVFSINNSGCEAEHNEILTYVRQARTHKAIVINPEKTIDMLIFVQRQKFKPTFDLTLISQQDCVKQQQFTVKLREQKKEDNFIASK